MHAYTYIQDYTNTHTQGGREGVKEEEGDRERERDRDLD
jgi:hypothetical protein